MQVLDNNSIGYVREYRVDKYFLDFLIEVNGKRLDLEIDGKQHQDLARHQHDLERDDYLKSQGYVVYRIPWNQINTQAGKDLMVTKITGLLDFLKSLG